MRVYEYTCVWVCVCIEAAIPYLVILSSYLSLSLRVCVGVHTCVCVGVWGEGGRGGGWVRIYRTPWLSRVMTVKGIKTVADVENATSASRSVCVRECARALYMLYTI